jgi:LacI family transcriptional regulator
MIKLEDVARAAGVSVATASLVMNNRQGVNKNTRTRVINTAKRLGYSPNNRARGLVLRKTNCIGLVVTDIENPFFGSITRYIAEYIRDEGYNLILSVSNDDPAFESQIILNFIRERVEGVVIVPTLLPKQETVCLKQLETHHIPYVFISSFYQGISCDCVMTDLEEGSYKMTNYLLSQGHRVLVILVSSNSEAIPSKLRIRGCKRAFEDEGLIFRDNWVFECAKTDFQSGFEKTKEIFQRIKPDAVMAINDIMALGAKRAIKELGYKIPEDISVAGCDDLIFSSISEIPLTTIKQNIPMMCRKTVDVLMNRIKKKRRSAQLYKIEPELIIRKSTGLCKRDNSAAIEKD